MGPGNKIKAKEGKHMSIGEKLAKLRKENNYTQEQLATILEVSRQSISKWESDLAYPETDKLIRLAKLYDCSLDYLMKDEVEDPKPYEPSKTQANYLTINLQSFYYEKKSAKTIFGLPLYHINIGYGRVAKGIIAIGLASRGFISIGLFSLGLFSIGLFSIGLLALGVISLGLLLSLGSIAVGIIAIGAISLGILSIGALSIGSFSIGAKAIGYYFAYGDESSALIAIGRSAASGSLFEKVGSLNSGEASNVKTLLDENVPFIFGWAKEIVKAFLG